MFLSERAPELIYNGIYNRTKQESQGDGDRDIYPRICYTDPEPYVDADQEQASRGRYDHYQAIGIKGERKQNKEKVDDRKKKFFGHHIFIAKEHITTLEKGRALQFGLVRFTKPPPWSLGFIPASRNERQILLTPPTGLVGPSNQGSLPQITRSISSFSLTCVLLSRSIQPPFFSAVILFRSSRKLRSEKWNLSASGRRMADPLGGKSRCPQSLKTKLGRVLCDLASAPNIRNAKLVFHSTDA